MDRTEKFIFYADTVLNCIPIVNTINSGLQALYKLAHRVDSVSPVASGFRTSLKIHVLSKSDFEYLVGATPILGNFYALAKLGLALCCAVREYYLDKALDQENAEVLHLYLQTHSLGKDEWGGIFRRAMESSNLLFEKVFYSRGDDWDAQFLINEGISRYTQAIGTQDEALYLENTKTILSYWEDRKNIDTESIFLVLELFLEESNEELVARAIALLPNMLFLDDAVEVLLKFSSQAVNGLMQELRDSLIEKIRGSSPRAFLTYHNRVMRECLIGQMNAAERDFCLGILNKLWNQIGSVAIKQAIQEAAKSGQLDFLKWMAEREGLSFCERRNFEGPVAYSR